MKTTRRTMPLLALAAVLMSTAAVGEDAVRLSKDDVQALVAGTELKYARADGNVVTWDVRKDGSIYFRPKSQRAVTVGGTWTVDDDGAFCTQWRSDKYVTMTDGCYLFVREGDKTRMTGKRNPDRVIGELVR